MCWQTKHVFKQKAKSKCACGRYYKENGRIFRKEFDLRVVANSPGFHYKGTTQTKREKKKQMKRMLRT